MDKDLSLSKKGTNSNLNPIGSAGDQLFKLGLGLRCVGVVGLAGLMIIKLNPPGTAGGPGGRDRTLAVKS